MTEKKKKKKPVIKLKLVEIDRVRPNDFNYNRQTNFIFEKQKTSIRKYGFLEPITCRRDKDNPENYEIVNGEHRYIALKELFKEGETIFLDVQKAQKLPDGKIPINDLGVISREEAQQLCIVLNEIKGNPNQDDLAKVIADLKVNSIDMEALPYTDIEIDSFVGFADGTGIDLDLPRGGYEDSDGEDDDGDGDDDGVSKKTKINANIKLFCELFCVEEMSNDDVDYIHRAFSDFMMSERLLQTEGHKGLVKLLEFWEQERGDYA